MEDRFIVLEKYSLTPSKLSTYNRVFRRTGQAGSYEDAQKLAAAKPKQTSAKYKLNKIFRRHHNFELSDNAHRTLKQKIEWLYYFSKARYVKTYSGKEIFNFKMAFLTLTLPSKQKTPTIDVTKRLFNQFLTEIRSRTKMENYVWRLEFQSNGNVHYHIATDTYIDYFFAQKIWNRILAKDGYIADFAAKFQGMSLSQYNQSVNASGQTSFNIIAKRYARGCAEKWQNPNSVDVKSVVSGKKIAFYISKYFSKDAKNGKKCNALDTKENSEALRLWFCSRSLSKLQTVSDFTEASKISFYQIVSKAKEVKEVVCRYARQLYYELRTLPQNEIKLLTLIFKDYAKKQGYQPSV